MCFPRRISSRLLYLGAMQDFFVSLPHQRCRSSGWLTLRLEALARLLRRSWTRLELPVSPNSQCMCRKRKQHERVRVALAEELAAHPCLASGFLTVLRKREGKCMCKAGRIR